MLTAVKAAFFTTAICQKYRVFIFATSPNPGEQHFHREIKIPVRTGLTRKEAEFAPGARYREWPSQGPTSKLASPAAALALAGAFDPACVQHRKHTHRIYLWCVYTQTLTHTHSNVPGRVHSIIIITHRARRSRFTVREIVICCRLHWSPTALAGTQLLFHQQRYAGTCNAILYVYPCQGTFYDKREKK